MKLIEYTESRGDRFAAGFSRIDLPILDFDDRNHAHLHDIQCSIAAARNALVTPDGFVIDGEGVFIEDLGYSELIGRNRLFRASADESRQGEVFLIWGHNNYYHWLFNWVPRVFLLELSGLRCKRLLIRAPLSNFQQDVLSSLVDLSSYTIEVGAPGVKYETILTPTFFANPLHSPFVVRTLRSRLFATAHARPNAKRRIYVSRRLAKYRQIENEAEFVSALAGFGFEEVVLENLSFIEQVELFRRAEKIVAPHGAGLANLAFASLGCEVVEIRNDFYTKVFWSLAVLVGAGSYNIWKADPVKNDALVSQRWSMFVDVKSFVRENAKFLA